MSQYFQAADTVLWNPSNGVAQLYVNQLDAIARVVEIPTGLGPQVADEYEIDMPVFTRFVDTLVRRYCSSNHPVLRSLIEAVAVVGIVVVERAGGAVPGLTDPGEARDTRDVAVFTTGPGAVGDPARLRCLADDLSQAMAR